MYVELDHALVAGKIQDINKNTELPGRVEEAGRGGKYLLKKYEVKNEAIMDILAAKDPELEPVVGTNDEVYFDHDYGFFSTILACYNNHWVLKTSPDDWWNVIVRNVAQAVDDKGKKAKIRKFFVAHEDKKTIDIRVGPSLSNIDYSWLFDQFAHGIKSNIQLPGYADLMQADFSTSGPEQIISTQIMLMSSLQKYFDYSFGTECGIPGVEMLGTEHDWIKLLEKTKQLRSLLEPVVGVLGLEGWFQSTEDMVARLLATYRGEPDKEWWGHVLSWNKTYGSGARSWWNGWMVDFLMAGEAEKPQNFQSGVVSVPVKIDDNNNDGVVDTGRLVAGTVGFTLEEGREGRPVVQARQGWVLLLPWGSPITPRIRGQE